MGGVRPKGEPSKPTLVFNATPLIYLAKAGLAARLKLLPYRQVTTEAVYQEVVEEGVRRGAGEAQELHSLFKAKVIEMQKVDDTILRERLKGSRVHRGEASVMALALKLQAAVVMDDQRARHVARTLGVKMVGTPRIVLEMVKQGSLSKEEAKRAVDAMVSEGWRCSPTHYSEVMRLIEEAP